ncbi:hypothetical protein D3C83_131040 [compost metagenome]
MIQNALGLLLGEINPPRLRLEARIKIGKAVLRRVFMYACEEEEVSEILGVLP